MFRKSSDQLVLQGGVLVLLVVLFHVTSALNLLYSHDSTGSRGRSYQCIFGGYTWPFTFRMVVSGRTSYIRGFVERRWMSIIRQCQMGQKQHFHVVEGRYHGAESWTQTWKRQIFKLDFAFHMTSFHLIESWRKKSFNTRILDECGSSSSSSDS